MPSENVPAIPAPTTETTERKIIGWRPGWVDVELTSPVDQNGYAHKFKAHQQGMVPVYEGDETTPTNTAQES